MIRPLHADEAEAVAVLLDEDPIPEGVTGDGIRHWLASQPERARAAVWVAAEEERGRRLGPGPAALGDQRGGRG